MTEWISTTDRLPDDDSTVLIAMDDGEVWTGYLEAGQMGHNAQAVGPARSDGPTRAQG